MWLEYLRNKAATWRRGLFDSAGLDHELDEELEYHLAKQTEIFLTQGMSKREARREAKRALGGLTARKEQCREVRNVNYIENLLQDLRYAVRVIRMNRAFAAAAVLTLALGIGANTAIFSLVYGVLLRPLPYGDGQRLVVVHQQSKTANAAEVPFSVKEVLDYRLQNHTLESVVEHHSMAFLLIGDESAERVSTAVVSANFFDALGVTPLHGRTFQPADEEEGSDAVLVLSNHYWQTRYGADPGIVGKMFKMNNRPHRVIGVLPALPQYPVENDVFMPTSQCPTRSSAGFKQNRNARMMTVFGRLKKEVSLPQAQADLSMIASNLQKSYPESYPEKNGYSVAVISLQEDLTNRGRTPFLVLLGAAGFVLLIACANVANLFLARLLRLEKELALRLALGADRFRLTRQLMTESLLLSLCGGVLGVMIAPFTLQLLTRFAKQFTTRAGEVQIDAPVLLFALLVSLLAGVLFGLAPVLSANMNLNGAMKQGGKTSSVSGRQVLRSGLVLTQVAISFMLLVGAGLMIRSFTKLKQVDPGFNPNRLLSMRVTPNFTRYTSPQQFQNLFDEILRRESGVAGAESVAVTTNVPLSQRALTVGPGGREFEIEGDPVANGQLARQVDITAVSEGYFKTMGQPVLNGREFTGHDAAGSLLVGVVNQAMAKHRWPNQDPVGKRLTLDKGKTWIKVAGVVSDAHEYGLNRPAQDELYLPYRQGGFANNLVVRTYADPMSLLSAVRQALKQIDPQLAVDQIATLEGLHQESVAAPRVVAWLMGLFAGLAIILSAIGIGSVVALSVSQRTQELGIRMALGEQPGQIVRGVVRQSLSVAGVGTMIGIAGALAMTRLLSKLLFETTPDDPGTFVVVSLLFIGVAALASFIPARQVATIDPLRVLRQE